MNHYTTTEGIRLSKSQIDARIRKAKQQVLQEQKDNYGYNFCTICYRNDDLPLDCSHVESVDSCQKNGYPEKAWDTKNIKIVGRRCHQKLDKLNIQCAKIT